MIISDYLHRRRQPYSWQQKAVDIVLVREANNVVTIDVKGLAGATSWPVDNVKKETDGISSCSYRISARLRIIQSLQKCMSSH